MELEVHVKLNMQVQDCTITYTVMKEAGLKRGMALGGGGRGQYQQQQSYARSKTCHANRFATVKGSAGGSIASTDLTPLILHYAVVCGHGIWGFCNAPAANNHTVIVIV